MDEENGESTLEEDTGARKVSRDREISTGLIERNKELIPETK